MENHLETVQKVLEQVNRVILGKEEEIREVMLAFLAKGHVLLEDIPGVGKTTLAVAFSRTMRLDYKRVRIFHIPERRGKICLSAGKYILQPAFG